MLDTINYDHHIFFLRGGGWGNVKNEKSDFPSIKGLAQILEIVAQIHTNDALMFGKKNLKI